MMKPTLNILVFGEILFDVCEQDARLGGAPLNLAVHLHRLGAETTLISAVGQDRPGDDAIRKIADEGIDTGRIARVSHPTGRVNVTLDKAKIPSYCFLPECAWDFIPVPSAIPVTPDLFCFGTLAQRGEVSRGTLRTLLAGLECKKFCDVNLRQNFYSKSILEESLAVSDLAKLNDEELEIIARLFNIEPHPEALAERFRLDTVILTLGPRGCEVWNAGNTIYAPACPAHVVSTVGAGDAFSAGFLFHFLSGSGLKAAAEEGNRLAAQVAALPGAF